MLKRGKAWGYPDKTEYRRVLNKRKTGTLTSGVKMSKYRRLIRYAFPYWRTLLLVVGLTGLTSALAVLQPWPLKILVDHALGDPGVPSFLRSPLSFISATPTPAVLLFVAAGASFGLFILNSGISVVLTWAWSAVGERMVYDLAGDVFHRLQRFSLLFQSRHAVGESLTCLSSDTYCVYGVVQRFLISPAQNGLTLIAISGVAWALDPRLTVLAFIVAPLQAVSAYYFGPLLKRRAQLDRTAQSRLRSFVHQTLSSIPAIQAFGSEDRNARQFRSLAADAAAFSQRGMLVSSAYGLVNGLATTIGTALALYVGALQVRSGALSVGTLLVFFAYMRSIQNALLALLTNYGSLKSWEVNVDRVTAILESDDLLRDAPGARPLPVLPAGQRGHVRLENVTFGYEPGRPVLKDVSLEARPGETVALVGATGAGKSTLVSLIPRFFDPWQGHVIVEGMDSRDVQLESLRSQVALVLQEPFLLSMTLADNIAYGRPRAIRDEIVAAAIAANADEFIRRLPEGYDTVIGERGTTLSGGQKQRVAIARALLKNAPILILDEPTSALDAETEAQLLQALERLMEGRTTFIIAHRLSTIRNADRIVLLDEGSVVEMGTNRELLADNGRYHHLHTLQFGDSPSMVTR
jgi:ATP-binding cassette subfamily B protein